MRRYNVPNAVVVGIYLSYSAAIVLYWLTTGRGSLVAFHLPTSVLAMAMIANLAFNPVRVSLRDVFCLNMVLMIVFLLMVPYLLSTLTSYQIGGDILVAGGHITDLGFATMRAEMIAGAVLFGINLALYLLLE